MNAAVTNPYEVILRLCAQAAPDPWYPRKHAQERGVDLDDIKFFLERLWLEQLLERTDGTPETGPGLRLSPEGERVLADPDLLERLQEGKPLREGDRGSIVRGALAQPQRPVLTRVLILANVLVFGYSLYLAQQLNILSTFLGLLPGKKLLPAVWDNITKVLHESGNVEPLDVLRGQWWRVMTADFVHMGALHVLMNMYCVWVVGRAVETMWGRLRYLMIYLVAAWGGACLSLAREATALQGASGAVCGIFAAEALWLLINARYLPGPLVRRARRGIVISVLLLVIISLFPGVSAWGHLGGALFGGAAALLLHWHRFGPSPWRWLALAALVPLPWLGIVAIDHARATNANWHQAEAIVYKERFEKRVNAAINKAQAFFQTSVKPLVELHPSRRDRSPLKLDQVLPEIVEQQQHLSALASELAQAGPYRSPEVKRERRMEERRLGKQRRRLELAERTLREKKRWESDAAEADEAADFEKKYLARVQRVTKTALGVYTDQLLPLLDANAKDRAPEAIQAGLTSLAEQRRQLQELDAALLTADLYLGDTASEAQATAEAYVHALSQLLAQSERCLRAGTRWTKEDGKKLIEQAEQTKELRRQWDALIERAVKD